MRVSTFLWFDGPAEEAAEFYTGLFADATVLDVQRDADGAARIVVFEIAGQRCIAHNGGPGYTFGTAISMYIDCDTQEEVDDLWAALTEGGEEGPSGSLTDRYGVTWQIIPRALETLLAGAGPDAAERVLAALGTMTRIDIQGLADARDGGGDPV
ncbi:Glyoxalase superfamily enzyme, possibly 3-demethylubiquinone-9 3-methyltransferase [Nocardiopsis flavescens]|uniref:Glyoxalase superfamily enzyme, possibly 3-demethylubiquinone-9 3-methyltransferase n=1 Tax=Nocardiopsis flavescens TaxID=758803 RepID=A0A1M6LVN1_9ACTN|nr:VOC family protein [Nocardiopsis flavescens]SHJ75254.1 Glyoxalase superfamily enzyme, possibly 3-demethylubiquinone-9 3-methyltransferase [Nocardiopsis flavescens]